jgi:chorismate mutase
VPLLGAREMNRPGALERVIRVLVHCYADPDRTPQHVYLREAVQLRQDLQGAQ